MTERIAGLLIALFYLSGRFTLASGDYLLAHEAILYEVRAWSLFTLICVAATYAAPRSDSNLRANRVSTCWVPALAIVVPIYVAASFFWTGDVHLAYEKALEAVIVAAACVCIVPFIQAGRLPVVRYWFWIGLVSAAGFMCIIGFIVVDSTRLSVLGGGANTFGRNMALLFFGCLYLQRQGSSSKAWRWYPLMAMSLIMVVLSGSRGALLAMSVGGFIYLVIDHRYRTRNIMAVGALFVALNVVLITTDLGERVFEMFETRILNQTIEQQDMSGRDALFADAYQLGLERPWFGHGLSGFKIVLGRNYPHNILLELFCETGIIGVLLCFGLLVAALSFVFRHRRRCDPATWGAFGLLLTSAMLSGNFFDSRGVFLMAMLGSQEIISRYSQNPQPRVDSLGVVRISQGSYPTALPTR